ncbi:MAG TPA: hypothetical protein VGX69_04195 [Solirubrobacteraceae bacterium]|jgi:hypothetical protein|nr:hypothetical protein [Solirubrobacteraceae bacterium]
MPTARRRQTTTAKPVWKQGARVKFHYTEPDNVEAILAEQLFRVPAESNRGSGLYVTTVAPGAMTDDKLRDLLFARGRPVAFIEGVMVLRDDAFVWERESHRKYLHRTGPGATLDLSLALIGIGIRRRGSWLWSEGVFA